MRVVGWYIWIGFLGEVGGMRGWGTSVPRQLSLISFYCGNFDKLPCFNKSPMMSISTPGLGPKLNLVTPVQSHTQLPIPGFRGMADGVQLGAFRRDGSGFKREALQCTQLNADPQDERQV